MPDPDQAYVEWARAAAVAERGTAEILRDCTESAVEKAFDDVGLLYAPAFGAIVAAGRFIRAISNPDDGRHVTEQWAMAYLRGALRDANGPVKDDGTPMERATDG
jgi:hypothetical protein